MPKFHLHGRVVPDGIKITIEGLPVQTWESTEGKTTKYLVNIVESHIGVEIDSEEHPGKDVSHIRSMAFELARAAVDSFCFYRGWGLSITLDQFFDENGFETILVPAMPGVGDTITNLDINTVHVAESGSLDKLYMLMAAHPTFALAFNDLIAAITYPRFAEINCARCTEGIRSLIAPDVDERQGWPVMRDKLNLSREFLKTITDMSRRPRHGDRHYIPPHEIENVIKRTWKVMGRFLEYAQRGHKLPIEEFELLSE